MTQIKRTPKKMRRRMKGGAEGSQNIEEELAKQESINDEVEIEIDQEREKLQQETLQQEKLQKEYAEREMLRQKEIEREKKEIEKIKIQMAKELQENAEKERLEKERLEKERLEKERLEKKDRVKVKQLSLEEADKQWDKANTESVHGIICRMEIPKISDRRRNTKDILLQINEFSKYKLNKTLTSPSEAGDAVQVGGLFDGRKEKKRVAAEEEALNEKEIARKKKEEEEDGLLNLSKITLDIIMGSGEKQTLGKEYLNKTLLYFHTIQPLMDYIQEDFDDMKKLIEDIKDNKILKIDGGQEQKDFIKMYNDLILENMDGANYAMPGFFEPRKPTFTMDLYNEFEEANYITFNSNHLSTLKNRNASAVRNTVLISEKKTNNEELNIKRQYLLEFISYIYITRKNDMESYLYYIEKMGDLTQYNPKKLHEGVETTEGVVETTEEVVVTQPESTGPESTGPDSTEPDSTDPELPEPDSIGSESDDSESDDSESDDSESTEAPSPAAAPERKIEGGYGGQYDKRRRTPVKRHR